MSDGGDVGEPAESPRGEGPALGNVLGFSLLFRERRAMLALQRRSLAPGTILRDTMFYPRLDVKPRQEISLLVRCGQANLRLKATSEGGAATGELVTVRLPDSNRRLQVRVTAPGTAELQVPAATSPGDSTKGI